LSKAFSLRETPKDAFHCDLSMMMMMMMMVSPKQKAPSKASSSSKEREEKKTDSRLLFVDCCYLDKTRRFCCVLTL